MFNSIVASKNDKYRAGGVDPYILLDFTRNHYKYNNIRRNALVDAAAVTRTGPATMIDRDGRLKWAPHNIMPVSVNIGAWSQDNNLAVNPTITLNYGLAPDNTLTAARVQLNKTGGTFARTQYGSIAAQPLGDYTSAIWMKTTNGGISNVGLRSFATGVNCVVTSEWKLFSVELLNDTAPSIQVLLFDSIPGNDETADILIWGPHIFRSDLGGMVDNPATNNSYVPTVSQAIYLGRVGNHKWDGSKWINKGIRVEESRTNLCTWSNLLTNAVHQKTGVTVTNNISVGPDGELSLARVTTTATTAEHQVYTASGVSVSSGAICSSGRFVRYTNTRYIGLRHYRSNSNWSTVVFDLQNRTITHQGNGVSSGTIHGAGVVDCGNGLLYLYLISAQLGTTLYAVAQMFSVAAPTLDSVGGGQVWTGTGAEHFDVGFCQDEVGTVPTSYMPTTASAVTRAADTIITTNGSYSTNGVCIAIEGEMDYLDTGQDTALAGNTGLVVFYNWRADADNYIMSGLSGASTLVGRPDLKVETAGVLGQSLNTDVYTPGINVPFSIAARVKPNAIQQATQGSLRPLDTSLATLPNLTSASIFIGPIFNGDIAMFRQWNIDVGEAGIVKLSR